MNSGAFHVMSQEWRYFSREKSIIHTLHLGQLAPMVTGQTVIITPVPPTGTGINGFGQGLANFPTITPYGGVNWTKVLHNVPPMWMAGQIFNSQQSGTYGPFSGTFYWPNANAEKVEQDWWPATGGTFLVIAQAQAAADSFDIMDTMRLQLFKTTHTSDRSDLFHQGDYFLKLQGAAWNNQMYISERVGGFEPMDISTIVQPPYGTAIGEYVQPSPLDPTAVSFNGLSIVILRLGP